MDALQTTTPAVPQALRASQPLWLDDPGRAWVLRRGAVDLFLVARRDGRPAGPRHHLFTLEAGAVLFAAPPPADEGVALMAVGAAGAETVEMPLAELQALAAQDSAGQVAAAVDGWLQGVGTALAGAPVRQLPVTPAALADGSAWAALAQGTQQLLTQLPAQLRQSAEAQAQIQAQRQQAGEAARQRAAAVLSQVLQPARGPVLAAAAGAPPLVQVFAAVVRAMGIDAELPAVPRSAEERQGTPLDALQRLLRANRLRAREIALDPGWWRARVPPFVLFARDDARPLAVLPAPRGGYQLFDPADGQVRPLATAELDALGGLALVVYPPLPDTALDGRALAGIALRSARFDFLTLLGFSVVVALLGQAAPVATRYLVDTAVPDHDLGGLATVAVMLAALAALMLVVRLAVQVAALRAEALVAERLEGGVLDRMLRLPVGFFKRFSAGDLATRVMAVVRVGKAVTATTVNSLLAGVVGLGALGLMAWYHLKLAGVALALIAAYGIFAAAMGWLRMRAARQAIELTSAVSGLTLQVVSGIAKLRLAGAEARVFDRWVRLYAQLSARRGAIATLDAVLGTVAAAYPLLATTAIFACIWWWAPADAQGGRPEIGLGAVLGFLAAFTTAFANLSAVVQSAIELVALGPVLRHAQPLLQALPETEASRADPGTLGGGLELSHVSFRYAPDLPPVFEDFSLAVAPGEFVALVGPSGCGKSTLLRLLLGFEQPQGGAVYYDGTDLRGLDLAAVRRQIVVVTQQARLMPGSVLDNIRGPNTQLSEQDAWAAAAQAGVADDIRAMPMGMHTVVTDGASFSGGQAQRLQIAHALAGRPRLLLLDEATSALDNRTQAIVTESLDRLALTRIVVAHRLSTVMHADRIVVLDRGRIVEQGAYAALIAGEGLFARMARRQSL